MKKEEQKKGKNLVKLLDVVKLAWPYRKTLFLAMVALLLSGAINLSIPEVIRRVLNSASLEVLMENPVSIGFLLIGVFTIQAVAFFFRSYWFGIVGHSVVFDLRKKLYSSLLRKPLSFFDNERTGDLVSRINADTLMLQDVVSMRLSVCIRYTLQVLIGVLLMAFISWELTGLIIILIPVLVLLARFLGKRLRTLTKEQQEKLGEATTNAEQSLGGIRTVKAFTGEAFEVGRFVTRINDVKELGFARSRFAATFASSVNLLMNGSLVVILLVGLAAVSDGTLSVGDLTAFLLYGAIVAISFAFLAGGISELYQASGAAERIFETINAEEETDDTTSQINTTPINTVEFKEVSFAYPTRPDELAVSDISFSASKGDFIALVGPSGAGKSTIMNLLLRFYDAKDGQILFDGEDISHKPIREVRSHIGLVPQDPLLFADTIEANLRYGSEDASLDDLRRVCSHAAILEFIESLPEGFQTYVGERGVQLSGGQKQRLAIARALLRKPDILLLDEATSSLDSESEALIQEALSGVKADCILIAIAHRLSTVQHADQILVLHRGKIAESGTHQGLVKEEGIYRELVTYQELVS